METVMVKPTLAAGTKAVLIAGPTASGKSKLALSLARQHGGVVVNADSMQVYSELRILTARPSQSDEAAVPHRLFGHVPAKTRYSVGAWLNDVAGALVRMRGEGSLPIIVGGTGLYFKVLVGGLAEVPPIPAEVRTRIRLLAEGEPSAVLHRRLSEVDPQGARRVRPSDRARITRALEVVTATGRPLRAWLDQPVEPLLDLPGVARFVLDPDRAVLHRRIADRVGTMVDDGAIAEVREVLSLNLSPDLPAMKAIGVRQLADHIAGKLTLEDALAGMRTETRRYAKRQLTWFRNQMSDWPRLAA